VEEILSFAVESTSTIGHDSLTLSSSDRTTQVGLARFAEFAFFALGRVELHSEVDSQLPRALDEIVTIWSIAYGNDVISNLNVGNAFSNRFYDSSSLVSENDRESTFGIISRELSCIV
jgi:hypothetical protein